MTAIRSGLRNIRSEESYVYWKIVDGILGPIYERLKKAMYWNKVNQSKELQRLKIDIVDAFQLDYDDFMM